MSLSITKAFTNYGHRYNNEKYGHRYSKQTNEELKMKIRKLLKKTEKYKQKKIENEDIVDYSVRSKIILSTPEYTTTIIGYDSNFDIIPEVQNLCEDMKNKEDDHCSIPEISVSNEPISNRNYHIKKEPKND